MNDLTCEGCKFFSDGMCWRNPSAIKRVAPHVDYCWLREAPTMTAREVQDAIRDAAKGGA